MGHARLRGKTIDQRGVENASLRREHLRPATLAFAARRQLLPLEAPEARATLILYDYYRGRLLGKLPFMGAAEFPLAEFGRAADASPTLRDMFLSSLFWVLLENRETGVRGEKGEAEAALRIPEAFLGRYPGNRLAREMRGSALYRAGRFTEARAEYENLRGEYWVVGPGNAKAFPERLPLGYYRAVGNLLRAQTALGNRRESEALRKEWNRGLAGPSGAWLPTGLKEAIDRL